MSMYIVRAMRLILFKRNKPKSFVVGDLLSKVILLRGTKDLYLGKM